MTKPFDADRSNSTTGYSRRNWLRTSAALVGGAAVTGGSLVPAIAADDKPDGPVATKGRINQSLVNWCYRDLFGGIEGLCQAAVKLGCKSIELCPVVDWPVLKKHGLTCAIASGGHGFQKGPNHKENQEMVRENLLKNIAAAKEFGCERVITFTGFSDGLTREEGAENCVEFFKSIVGDAEKAGVTLCLEMLNTRDDTHKMKGHPGYQGDDTEYCIDICKAVGSDHFKLLFDIYHVQIMNGDVIRRIHQHKDWLGHIHTAGNPGRGELDQTQEINYPACMQALLDVGYKGYVGQEFIPTRDAMEGLREAVAQCDI